MDIFKLHYDVAIYITEYLSGSDLLNLRLVSKDIRELFVLKFMRDNGIMICKVGNIAIVLAAYMLTWPVNRILLGRYTIHYGSSRPISIKISDGRLEHKRIQMTIVPGGGLAVYVMEFCTCHEYVAILRLRCDDLVQFRVYTRNSSVFNAISDIYNIHNGTTPKYLSVDDKMTAKYMPNAKCLDINDTAWINIMSCENLSLESSEKTND
jgi:hypothetical protein